MSIEISILISIISVASAVFFALKNTKRSDISEIERKAAENAKINAKLDDISGDVKDIKYDISVVKKDVSEHDRQLVAIDQSVKSAHKRIDEIVGKDKL